MTALIFDGKEFAREKEGELKEKVSRVSKVSRVPRVPKLVAILIGDNPESELYLKLKEKAAKRLGIEFEWGRFGEEDFERIVAYIDQKNNDSAVNGIIVELPLPEQLVISNKQLGILDSVDPRKDIDCLTSENVRLLDEGKPRFIPPTVKAVGEILNEAFRVGGLSDLRDLNVVVVGSKGTVGKGILSYLRYLGNLSNLRGIDRETKDLASVTKTADVLISATGVGHLIKKEMVKEGAIVIDVGIEKKKDMGVIGDVDSEKVNETASFITPVPGGVGPVTIACLMENLLRTVYY